MSAGFTKGPWVFNEPWAGFSSIEDADGNLIFGIARGDPDEAQPVEVCKANAALIAAAPELYEALAEVLADHNKTASLRWTDKATAILAKARGDQPCR